MSDLINRQVAIELIENESRKWGDEYGVSDVLCDLADLPSAQPEIVRCKDCRHSDWYESADGQKRCYCMANYSNGLTEKDYCSRGERRSE